MSWTYRPEPSAPNQECAACAARVAGTQQWATLASHWWGLPALAGLGAALALVLVGLRGAPLWTVPLMAVGAGLLVLAGPPAEQRCDVHRRECPACGGRGEPPGGLLTVRAPAWAMGAAGAAVGAGVAFLFYVARMILTPWLFSEPPAWWEYVVFATFPVVGGLMVGSRTSSVLLALQEARRDLECARCRHRWRLPSMWARAR